jgi:hypothetical protein
MSHTHTYNTDSDAIADVDVALPMLDLPMDISGGFIQTDEVFDVIADNEMDVSRVFPSHNIYHEFIDTLGNNDSNHSVTFIRTSTMSSTSPPPLVRTLSMPLAHDRDTLVHYIQRIYFVKRVDITHDGNIVVWCRIGDDHHSNPSSFYSHLGLLRSETETNCTPAVFGYVDQIMRTAVFPMYTPISSISRFDVSNELLDSNPDLFGRFVPYIIELRPETSSTSAMDVEPYENVWN